METINHEDINKKKSQNAYITVAISRLQNKENNQDIVGHYTVIKEASQQGGVTVELQNT